MALPPHFITVPRILPCLVALGGLLLASCYPYPEDPPYQPTRRATPRPAPAAPVGQAQAYAPVPAAPKIPTPPEKRTSPPAAHPLPSIAAQTAKPTPPTQPTPPAPAPQSRPATPPAAEKPAAASNSDLPVAAAAPGKAGYVLSPYNHKLILVRGIPSGTVVPDPAYPDSDKKFFRVP